VPGVKIRVGPRIKKLRGLLAKLDPASTEPAVTPYRHRGRALSQAFSSASCEAAGGVEISLST
jgi:hypothetical protein